MQNVKGTYDFFGAEQALRSKVQSVLQEVFELYDYGRMESTILNELDLLASKYAGGDEIMKEMYQLTDQGKRSLGLRYDLTIPFSKVVAWNPGIELPFRRYEIGKVFRDGPVKRGRLREFLQCDVDVVGIEGPEAEAELILIAVEAFKRLEIPILLKWNNRRFLGELLEAVGVAEDQKLSVMLTLDKIEKIGIGALIEELREKGINETAISEIAELAVMEEPSFQRLSSTYGLENSKGSMEVLALQQLLDKLGLGQTCRFDPFLSRGLSFYTGTVYEIFDAEQRFGSSLGGGGRYDAIIGKLAGREDIQYPTAGISFGMESIMEMLKERPIPLPMPLAAVIPIGDTTPEALKAAAELRASGIRTSIEMSRRKLKKALASAASKGIRYVILIGSEEAEAGMLRLKDMRAMTETLLSVQDAIAVIGKEGE
ncbi:histidine--tRNA ligase [Paenibacillus radicis (ex Gao et al. 2016)]|uniref:Histidine--tRNA ligase n=1 Tax=Paenibacillus radicis (ex Gao et al. 2016) TaxID=1737354 RepID=A0A917MBA3_9BACL|nr:histidine--tRNA ligase [Paenibacillus radicis (ex Gao et al. 2016)]GGG89343.1 histidine--tRNA ligase 1 [Paenibacillus radicis (ex Gao et al. 2016)]